MPIIERDRELTRHEASGWATLSGLPSAIGKELREFLASRSSPWWDEADARAGLLHTWLEGKRFGDQVELGLLYVPSPTVLDVRSPMDLSVRQAQRSDLLDDVVDPRLNDGVDLVPVQARGSLFVSCIGRYGPALGSFAAITDGDEADYRVAGYDVRTAMTRQLWAARVLQAGSNGLPDTEHNDFWTFTLFVGDGLVDGMAGSGTALKSHVRFRLGKADRGIGSARVAPAVPLDHLN